MEGEVVSSKPTNEPRKKKTIKFTTRLLAGRLNSSFHFLICFCTLQSLFTTTLRHIANYCYLFNKVINMEDTVHNGCCATIHGLHTPPPPQNPPKKEKKKTAIHPCAIHHLRKRISVMDLKSDSTTNQTDKLPCI